MAWQAQQELSTSGRRVPEGEGTPLTDHRAKSVGCLFSEWRGAKRDVLTGQKTLGSCSATQQCPMAAAACKPWPQGSAVGDKAAGDMGAVFKVPIPQPVSGRKTGLPAQG